MSYVVEDAASGKAVVFGDRCRVAPRLTRAAAEDPDDVG